MGKDEALAVMGKPVGISASGDTEYLRYWLENLTRGDHYFLRFVDGKLEAFGRHGDFGSAAPIETKSTIDLKMRTE
jgi:hypothetical protein